MKFAFSIAYQLRLCLTFWSFYFVLSECSNAAHYFAMARSVLQEYLNFAVSFKKSSSPAEENTEEVSISVLTGDLGSNQVSETVCLRHLMSGKNKFPHMRIFHKHVGNNGNQLFQKSNKKRQTINQHYHLAIFKLLQFSGNDHMQMASDSFDASPQQHICPLCTTFEAIFAKLRILLQWPQPGGYSANMMLSCNFFSFNVWKDMAILQSHHSIIAYH
ncbi:Aspartyl/glutamyl-tRNA(Asn/Gln) amidotransferase subunit [Trichinella spiralis]|uniref:Aspartyl/glutamyl-tRNA(Asn/Gln) amidotransferase subunit n=1 Tax=Trichinella spiralis TaxID=6334 RepID=A0ABR3KWJ4_TRISP